MDFSKLEKNVIDIIQEEQIKLGYRKETIRLYYPLPSLNRLLDTDCDAEKMCEILGSFCNYAEARLGQIHVSHQKERFCFAIPSEGSEYIHEKTECTAFIRDFIHTVSRHGTTIEEVLQQFHKHSDHVHVEKLENGEFDYLVYFEDGIPDNFRYCITDEGCHIIYHRFTEGDYDDLQHPFSTTAAPQ